MKQYEFMKDTDENGNSSVSLSSRRKRRLDLIPRLLCLFVALIIWLWMVNVNDTDVTATMVLKVEYSGLEMLEKNDMMIYGMDKNEILITVKGSNRDIRKHDSEDYSAVVDVSTIDSTGDYTLPLTVVIPSDVNVTVSSEPLNVSLIADKILEKEVSFDARSLGLYSEQGITFSHIVKTSTDKVSLKGPEQIVDMISSARLNFDGSYVATEDEKTFENFPLTFLDSNGFEVMDTYGAVQYSTEEIAVNAEAVAHKKINLTVEIKNQDGSLIPKLSTDSIEVWGVPSVVREIKDEYLIKVEKAEIGKSVSHTFTDDDFPLGANIGNNITVVISFEEPVSQHAE